MRLSQATATSKGMYNVHERDPTMVEIHTT